MDQVIYIVTYLVTLSVAAERFTEIIKRAVLSKRPEWIMNGATYQIIAAVFGMAAAYANPPVINVIAMKPWLLYIVAGLAVSGGSGAWNSILTLLTEYAKNQKESSKS